MLEELDWDLVALLLGDREADLLWNGLLDLDGMGLVRQDRELWELARNTTGLDFGGRERN